MKKKIVTLALVAAMVAVAIAGATLAYFTDTKKADNTFTVGGVKIELIEQQRGENGLEDFAPDKVLMPIVGSAQGENEEIAITDDISVLMPTAENYVDKIITVKNTGVSDAWVRCYFAIPTILDDGAETFNASANSLHFNFGDDTAWAWKTNGAWNYFETEIDGIDYNVYYADYATTVAADELTEVFVKGLYLDKNVNMDADGNLIKGEANLGNWSDGVVCPVAAIAVQAEGFDAPAAAFTEAFGATFNPFA